MFFRHSTDKLIIPVIIVIVLLVLSYKPKYHLRAEMPDAFFQQEKGSEKPSVEQKIAWAYWETAQMNIQWKYGHGRPLPVDPPPEFQISAKALGPGASDRATRLLYWRRLQEVWYLPETWKKDYEFDWSWLSDPGAGIGEWFRGHTPRFLR
jgi:hypothetical protein